jgi:hypothetical protein
MVVKKIKYYTVIEIIMARPFPLSRPEAKMRGMHNMAHTLLDLFVYPTASNIELNGI